MKLCVHLQLQRSNQTQVYLDEVSSSLAGNLSCEVTTDDTFITKLVYTNLIVAGESEELENQAAKENVQLAASQRLEEGEGWLH